MLGLAPRLRRSQIEPFACRIRLVLVNSPKQSMEHWISVGTASGESQLADRREAFDRLTQARLDRAYRLAAAILSGDAEAEDAVHDAAVQAWTRWATLRDESRFDAWFDRIVVNVCRDRLRRSSAASRKVATLSMDLADRVVKGEDDSLREAVAGLSPDHRIVIVLRFADDLDIAEIARRTGQREGTVKSRLHYALREVRAAYDAAHRSKGADR
jgi:RNA polymerase sigma-70 factor (ECF subfamily)